MDIGFVWDQEQYKEVQKNHQLQFYEVVILLHSMIRTDTRWLILPGMKTDGCG